MLLLNISKNVFRPSVRRFSRFGGIKKNQIERSQPLFQQVNKLPSNSVISSSYIPKRFNCDERNPTEKVQLRPLLDEPLIIMPNPLAAIKCSYYLHWVLGSRIDPEFDILEFAEGSKQAVEYVSNALAQENYDSLVGLMANGVIEKLRDRISKLSEAEKELIPIKKEDIYGFFPYKIDPIYEGEGDAQKTFIEITMIFFSLRGLHKMKEKGEMPPLQMGLMPEYQDKIYICNYRFRRDYTDGNNEPWIVTMCNEALLIAA